MENRFIGCQSLNQGVGSGEGCVVIKEQHEGFLW